MGKYKLIQNVNIIDKKNKFKQVDVLIKNDKLEKVSKKIEISKYEEVEVINAENKLLLPGIIDVHTHMREPGLIHKENLGTGSKACAKGGITTYFDMPNTKPETINLKNLKTKQESAKNTSYVNYGFNFGGSSLTNIKDLKILKTSKNNPATKIFFNNSTGNMKLEDEEQISKIFINSNLIMVHAEGESVKKVLKLAKKYDKNVYFCHISTKHEIEMLKKFRNENKNIKIYIEVTPHHLFLTDDYAKKNNLNEKLFFVKPKLKTEDDINALWEAINDGTVDTIGTDHAPHLLKEKLTKTTYGLPGVETSLVLMMQAVANKKITYERLIQLMSENPAKIFKIKNRGKLAENYYADMVLLDLKYNGIIKNEQIISKCSWTPFENFKINSKVIKTFVNGIEVYNENLGYKKNGMEVEIMTNKEIVANILLETKAVKLDVKNPFTFVSGIKSPIYCDNRLLIGEVEGRKKIVDAFIEIINISDVDVIAGVATAGIAWAAYVSDKLNLPMSYIRDKSKGHGTKSKIEGAVLKNKRVIIIEDLISTGLSSNRAVISAKEAGAKSIELLSIFTYEFEKSKLLFEENKVNFKSLSNFSVLMDVATQNNYLTKDEVEIAKRWNIDSENWYKNNFNK